MYLVDFQKFKKLFELFCPRQKEQIFKTDTIFFELHNGTTG